MRLGKPCSALLAVTLLLSACNSVTRGEPADAGTVEVQLLAFNDFHGALEAPATGLLEPDPLAPGKTHTVAAGGIARLATLAKQRARGHRNSLIVAAGDLIGASPLLSSRFHDEPAIEALTSLGLSLSSVGNHEFDQGLAELKRLQQGGCHPQTGCLGSTPFKGAGFQYLAANVIDDSTGQSLFPSHAIREFDGVRVGFIGLTLTATPTILTPAARQGLHFLDEATTINREVAVLRAEGIEALVVLLHEGGYTDKGPLDCASLRGSITDILPKLDKAVDVVISGHTHRAYNCKVNGLLLTSAGQNGMQLSDISLTLDRHSGDVVAANAEILPVASASLAEDPTLAALVARYQNQAGPMMQRQVAVVSAPLSREKNAAGESVMGAVIADAMLDYAAHSSGETLAVAFMNPGGVRGGIPSAGPVSFADLFATQPFGNKLVVLTLSGADIETVLAQQFASEVRRILHVSAGFSFRWREPRGGKAEVVPGSIRINGEPLQPERRYRIVTNDFIATGGDGFTAFARGSAQVPAGVDVDALEAWLALQPVFTPPAALQRITLEAAP